MSKTEPKAKTRGVVKPQQSETLTTAIHIRRDHWELLREVAFNRARATGGRASVSAVIGDLIEQHKAEIAREARKS